MGLKAAIKPRPRPLEIAESPARGTTLTPRPGLPLFDNEDGKPDDITRAELRAVADSAAQDRAMDSAQGDGGEGGGGDMAGQASSSTATPETGTAAAGAQAAPEGEAGEGGATAPAQAQTGNSPNPPPSRGRAAQRETVKPPVPPPIPLPDLSSIRAPLVPPPPRRAIRKRDDIFKATGKFPELHHAQIQQGINRIADAARTAQRDIVFQIGTIAAQTRWSIEGFARRIPGIVAKSAGAIRRVAAQVKADVTAHAQSQMREVANHVRGSERELDTTETSVMVEVQAELLQGRTDLQQAKTTLDNAYRRYSGRAAAQMRRIPNGTKPTPMAPQENTGGGSGGGEAETEEAPEYLNFDEAEAGISGQLMAEQANRVYQYGNLLCAGALGGQVTARKERYRTDNGERAGEIANEENLARFFVTTMGLVAPTIEAEDHDEPGYQDELQERIREQYPRLSNAKRAVIAQMTFKLEGVQANLDPANAKSIPAKSIEGLQKAGKKIEKGLMDQARIAQATLKSSTAQLAKAYPDLVARLGPLVASGRFLEADATMKRLEEAKGSLTELHDGQVQAIKDQSKTAVGQTQSAYHKQVRQIQDMAQKSINSIVELKTPITFDFELAASQYTLVIDDGMRAATRAAQGYAGKVAKRVNRTREPGDTTLSFAEKAALRGLDGVLSGEYSNFISTVNDLKSSLGGVEQDEDSGKESVFKGIRDSAREDLLKRFNDVKVALPEGISTDELLMTAAAGPLAPGLALGYLAYRAYETDPDESAVTTALAIPWPGPAAVDQWGIETVGNADGFATLYALIDERMDEPERSDVLDLFSPDPATREEGRTSLLTDADSAGGISDEAVMALARSYSAEELDHLSQEDRTRLAQSLESNLNSTNLAITTAYINGEPDRALAIRMRQLFDGAHRKTEREQMAAAEQMDQLIRDELFVGSGASVPPEQMAAMRDAAFLRFGEVIEPGAQPPGIITEGQQQERRRQAVEEGREPSTPSPSQLRRPPPPIYGPPAPPALDEAPAEASETSTGGDRPPTPSESAPPVTDAAAPPTPAPAETPPATEPTAPETVAEPPDPDVVERMERQADIDAARDVFLTYVTRPREYYPQQGRHGGGYIPPNATYNPETGRYSVPMDESVANYIRAVAEHGASSPEARGIKAASVYSRVSNSSFGLSSNEQTELNAGFSDNAFNQMRVRWENASDEEREDLAPQWEKAQADHNEFLRQTAAQMGMSGATDAESVNMDTVRQYLTSRLGEQFAREGEGFRAIGEQIVNDGRVNVELGVKLASDGLGTNEDLFRAVMGGRARSEIDAHRDRLDEYIADETSGGLEMELQVMMLGQPSNDRERAEVAALRARQQLRDGTGFIASHTMADRHETAALHHVQGTMAQRMFDAAHSREPADPDLPATVDGVFNADGSINQAILRNAFDEEGAIVGDGPPFNRLTTSVGQSAQFYQDEIDRQESTLTNLITALSIAVSVLLLFIPGVNLVAAGILTALIAGTATVVVKQGMRGGRYGWEEMALDVAKTGVEAATAGVGGALGGAGVNQASKLARVGAAINTRFGPIMGPAVREGLTGAASVAANTAMEDSTWNDGLGRGIARVAGGAAQGGVAGMISGGVSEGLTKRMNSGLARGLADPDNAAILSRAGRRLGPNGNEMLTEMLANTAGSLSSEGFNIIVDMMQGKQKMDFASIAKRLGQAGLQELVSSGGRTAARQRHRRTLGRMRADIRASGRDPTPGELSAMRRLGISAGTTPLGTKDPHTGRYRRTSDIDVLTSFSRATDLIGSMPKSLQPHLQRMGLADIEAVMARLDQGSLGTRQDRLEFVQDLSAVGSIRDVKAFDAALRQAHKDLAPRRRERRHAERRAKQARNRMLSEIKSGDRDALVGLPMDTLTGLPVHLQKQAARIIADGDGSPAALQKLTEAVRALDTDIDVDALSGQLRDLAKTRAKAAEARVAQDLATRDTLKKSAPPELHGAIDALPARDVAQLGKIFAEPGGPDAKGMAMAEALLRKSVPGLDGAAAKQIVAHTLDAKAKARADRHERAMEARKEHLDNVPAGLRRVMAELPDDALMEVRVAQFTRKALPAERVKAMVAAAKAANPKLDVEALTSAITRTVKARYGRPGFRQALAQKRALLDLVPFGMKRTVLRTPVLTLPDAAFRSYVRGDSSEHAVTLILDGRPVVLIREGAALRNLGEEGIHVLQHHDPQWRDRVAGLGEERMAGWDDLSLEAKVRAYRDKIAIEIDGQQRMLARLKKRRDRSLWPGGRQQAALDIQLAETTLAGLSRLAGRVEAMTPDRMLAIARGLEPPPKWLERPARMFAMSDADVVFVKDKISPDLKTAIDALRGGDGPGAMPKDHQDELMTLARRLRGAMPEEQFIKALGDIRDRGLPPDKRLEALRKKVLLVDNPAEFDARVKAVAEKLGVPDYDPRKAPTDPEQAKIWNQLKELATLPVGQLELRDAQLTMLLVLEKSPTGHHTQKKRVFGLLDLAHRILTDKVLSGEGGFARPSYVKAAMIEALAKEHGFLFTINTRNTAAKFLETLDDVLSAGVKNLGNTDPQLRETVDFAIRALLEGRVDKKFEALVELVKAVTDFNAQPGIQLVDSQIRLDILLKMVTADPAKDNEDTLSKLAALVAEAAKPRRSDETSASGDRPDGFDLDPKDLSDYIAKILEGDGIETPLLAALVNIGGRVETHGALTLLSDLHALQEPEPMKSGQKSFSERHRESLWDSSTFNGVDVATLKGYAKKLAANGLPLSSGQTLDLDLNHARAIAKRMDALEHIAIFARRFGHPGQSIDAMLARFGDSIADSLDKSDDMKPDEKGDLIDAEFRRFVRDEAKRIVQGIAQNQRVIPERSLTPEAQTALINMFLRGRVDTGFAADLPPAVKTELQPILDKLVADYNASIGASTFASVTKQRRSSSIDDLFGPGIFGIERTGKGKMLERVVDLLFDAVKLRGQLPPETLERYLSFVLGDRARGRFKGPAGKNRSLDHVVHFSGEKVSELGLPGGRDLGVDSKNGEGAFDNDQFKRYLIEVLKSLSPDDATAADSIFGEDKLAGFLYLSNNAANMESTRRAVRGILEEIIDSGKITIGSGDKAVEYPLSKYGLDLETLGEKADQIHIFFARLGMTEGPTDPNTEVPPQRVVGQLAFSEDTVAKMIAELLAEKQRDST